MSEKAVRVLWSFVGLIGATFAFSAILRTLGTESRDTIIPLNSYGSRSVTLLAIPLGSALVLIVLWLTRKYPMRLLDSGWASRMPTFYFDAEDIKPEHRDGRLYQAFFFVGFILMPVLAQLVFLRKFLFSKARDPKGDVFATRLEHFWPSAPIDWGAFSRGDYRLEEITYFPIVLAWLFLLIDIIVLYSFWLTMRHLLRTANPALVARGGRGTLARPTKRLQRTADAAR